MKKLRYLGAMIVVSVFLLGGSLSAQDEGTYIDNASPQDSSYVAGDALNFDEYYEKDSGSNLALYIGAAVVVVGAVVVIVLRKKKKK
ncbi:MAG: LPXTG cell wall anchor domain-containing protein [Prolixibacteraceae bacterium]|nr:LPXTG cell wall anchor domain-containing protein [Prolixibacteraceae bacterium]MBN2774299.1 LPXTG cell wall anchor domain-containing protein [Prolixibacteraceae bacterium]